jgi:hypothetical protein
VCGFRPTPVVALRCAITDAPSLAAGGQWHARGRMKQLVDERVAGLCSPNWNPGAQTPHWERLTPGGSRSLRGVVIGLRSPERGAGHRSLRYDVRSFGLAVGSTMTLCRAGIQHRVRMTGNQPGHDLSLPRPALAAKRAACLHHRTDVLFLSRAVRGESQIAHGLSPMANSRAPPTSEILHCIQNDRRGDDANLHDIPRSRPRRSAQSDRGQQSLVLTIAAFQKLDLLPWQQVSATS